MPKNLLPPLALCALLAPCAVSAAEVLETVTVSATRLRSVPDFDVPASVATVRLDSQNNRGDVNISESLAGIPGLAALDRQNYAQDTQLSIRGFGARSTFGVRGVRLFADGIPASMPDGQGQMSHFNVSSGERIEVMRGPFSALYGNSSGGVVQLWSKDGEAGDASRVKASTGSNDVYTVGAQALGRLGLVGYNIAASRFETDGYREHSAARRDSINAKLNFNFSETRRLDLIVNYVDLPEAQDPLGLTRAAWLANPGSANIVATQFNTRKTVEQLQAGLVFEQSIGSAQTLRVMAYGGNRQVEQFLALPAAAQASPLNSGGDIDLDSDYGGGDVRWSWQGELGGRPLEFTIGANYDRQSQLRNGYENFVGTTLGIRGRLRRDETNKVENTDEFAQVWWQLAPQWAILAGVRHSEVEFRSKDRYIVAGNPDDSGGISYGNTTPVAGLMFSPSNTLRVYASAGRGFETPTFNELGYRADGGAGLALNLRPAISNNYELGAKWRLTGGVELNSALFRADTNDELAVARNVGGRSSYQNVGSARRQGFETSLDMPFAQHWNLQLAYTYLDATFRSNYLVCTGAGCTVPNVPVAAGSRIPGVARNQGFASIGWADHDWSARLETVGASDVVVNDIATVSSPGYVIAHGEAGRNWALSSGSLRTFLRVENILGRDYVGSVIVNEGNGRYYESGPGRSFLLGAQWQWRP
ncbi:MAG: TonB-dependent receptor [Pseudomonadota bacterium]